MWQISKGYSNETSIQVDVAHRDVANHQEQQLQETIQTTRPHKSKTHETKKRNSIKTKQTVSPREFGFQVWGGGSSPPEKLKNEQTLSDIGWEEYPDTPPRLALSKVLADTLQYYHLHQNNRFSCKLQHYKLSTANTLKAEQTTRQTNSIIN